MLKADWTFGEFGTVVPLRLIMHVTEAMDAFTSKGQTEHEYKTMCLCDDDRTATQKQKH